MQEYLDLFYHHKNRWEYNEECHSWYIFCCLTWQIWEHKTYSLSLPSRGVFGSRTGSLEFSQPYNLLLCSFSFHSMLSLARTGCVTCDRVSLVFERPSLKATFDLLQRSIEFRASRPVSRDPTQLRNYTEPVGREDSTRLATMQRGVAMRTIPLV